MEHVFPPPIDPFQYKFPSEEEIVALPLIQHLWQKRIQFTNAKKFCSLTIMNLKRNGILCEWNSIQYIFIFIRALRRGSFPIKSLWYPVQSSQKGIENSSWWYELCTPPVCSAWDVQSGWQSAVSEFLQERDKLWTRSSNSSQIPLCMAGMIGLDGQLNRSTAAFNIRDTLTHFTNV